MNFGAHIEFDGPTNSMKLWLIDGATKTLKHTIEARGAAVGDPGFPDPYGHLCKCPPGEYYLGAPQACATRNADNTVAIHEDDDAAYGCFFTPMLDAFGALAAHGRLGNGNHGGGTVLPDPFALEQGWYFTEGCIRLRNIDNEQIFVPFVRYVRAHNDAPDSAVRFTVSW